ncbi:unnamed protein product, partial [Ectocarpus sp. 4 AP-2014]
HHDHRLHRAGGAGPPRRRAALPAGGRPRAGPCFSPPGDLGRGQAAAGGGYKRKSAGEENVADQCIFRHSAPITDGQPRDPPPINGAGRQLFGGDAGDAVAELQKRSRRSLEAGET